MNFIDCRWVWKGTELINSHGESLAVVRSDVIHTGEERLLIESMPVPLSFTCRATTATGNVFTLVKKGFSVRNLHADCVSRHYHLQRVSPWRKERVVRSNGREVAHIHPLHGQELEITLVADIPFIDAVFLSWGCVLVDVPERRTRI